MNFRRDSISNLSSQTVLVAMIPGPSRKRENSIYSYRMVFRNPEPETDGCLALWHVSGGRMTYQVAIERDMQGQILWHCTCADHVFRHELSADHCCKHVGALRNFMPPMPEPTAAWAA
jgi:hypothetical protein